MQCFWPYCHLGGISGVNAGDVPEEVLREKAAIQQRGQLGAQTSSLSVWDTVVTFPKYLILVQWWDEFYINTHIPIDKLSICVIVCRF